MKRLIALIMVVLMVFCGNVSVFAEELQETLASSEEEQGMEYIQEKISYVTVQNPQMESGETQNIVIGLEKSEEAICEAVLVLRQEETGTTMELSASQIGEDYLLFETTIVDAGSYALEALKYKVNDQEESIQFTQIGMQAKFGVGMPVDDGADAYVVVEEEDTDEATDDAKIQYDIVTFDENGNQISEQSIGEAIDNADNADDAGIAMQSMERAVARSAGPVVVLDPGHGGKDSGTTHAWNGKNYYEKDLNLKIAQYCKAELEQYKNVTVYMTRNNDTYVELTDRVSYAKSVGATVFVSIHINSNQNSSVNGAAVYYPNSNGNAGIGSKGQQLASKIENRLVSLGLANKGILVRDSDNGETYPDGKLTDYYSVIRNSKYAGFPGIIVEHAFLSNYSDTMNYLNSDVQLKKLGVADATGIAEYFGLSKATPGTEYNGTNYELVFDASYYLNRYPDVRNAVHNDPQAALEHFVANGMREGRQGREEFNVTFYKNKYPDLQRAFGTDLSGYYKHYMTSGVNEGRQPCDAYDAYSYRARYADLQRAYGTNWKGYYQHYIRCGKKEGRNAKKDNRIFTVNFIQNGSVISSQQVEYGHAASKPQVSVQNGATVQYDRAFDIVTDNLNVNVYGRYIYGGVDYTAVFDADHYLTKYPDLRKAYGNNGASALSHFVNNGMKEARQAKESFNVRSYKNRYWDLRKAYGNDWKAYFMHYINCGQKENRTGTGSETTIWNAVTVYNGVDYSAVYDANYYLSHHADVLKAYGYDENGLLQHFVLCGMKEGRQAKESFNMQSYKNRYWDLRKAFGNDKAAYYRHYINNGVKEKRIGTGSETTIWGAATVYNGIDYSAVYDANYYLSHHADVLKAYGYDENGLLQHFVLCGMKEGRQAKEDFNVQAYKNRYADLRRAFGNDLKQYYLHYINCGKKEGRTAV